MSDGWALLAVGEGGAHIASEKIYRSSAEFDSKITLKVLCLLGESEFA